MLFVCRPSERVNPVHIHLKKGMGTFPKSKLSALKGSSGANGSSKSSSVSFPRNHLYFALQRQVVAQPYVLCFRVPPSNTPILTPQIATSPGFSTHTQALFFVGSRIPRKFSPQKTPCKFFVSSFFFSKTREDVERYL